MKSYLVIFCVLASCAAFSQPAFEQVYFSEGCNYIDDEVSGLLLLRKPGSNAQRIIDEILITAGSAQNFELRISDQIANARATASGGRKFILYNEGFMNSFQTKSLTYWAAYSLLAHEIGHHVLGHDFATPDARLRKEQELKADAFAARIMYRLSATIEEVLAGIRTFDNRAESATHPNPAEREAAIREAFLIEARQSPLPLSSALPDSLPRSLHPEKSSVALDATAFRNNRWNLLNIATAEIDDEKISIRYRLEGVYPGRKIKVCLLSNDPLIGPELRTLGAVSGQGAGLDARREGLIVWNYRIDRYTKNEVSKEDMLRVLVYDMSNLPHTPSSGAWVGSVGAVALGVGSATYGLLERKKALDIYEVYKDVRDPAAAAYSDESRTDRYTRADKKYIKAQYFLWGGVAAALGGGTWLYDKIRQNKSCQKDGQCSTDSWSAVSPILLTSGRDLLVGVQLSF